MSCCPNISISQPAAARNGPKAIGVERCCPLSASIAMPTTRAHGRGDQNDRQQHLPAEPGAERREELEVTVAHAFLAGEEPEQMIDAPQAHVTRYRADQTRTQVHREAECRRMAPRG